MDLEDLWDKALKGTEIVRTRAHELATFETTAVPYVFVAESGLNVGDTVVRKGQVLVERPSLILPSPHMEGFAAGSDALTSEEALVNFFLVRGIRFPSLRYRHELSSLDLREGSVQQAIDAITAALQYAEDLRTSVVVGPEEAWQFSLLILVGSLMARSAEGDLRRLVEAWRARHRQGPGT